MLIRRPALYSFFFGANYGSPGTAIYIEKILFNFHEILLGYLLAVVASLGSLLPRRGGATDTVGNSIREYDYWQLDGD